MNREKKTTNIKFTLFRVRIIFAFLFTALLLSTGVSFNAGWKSGEIKRNIIGPVTKPVNEFVREMEKLAEEASQPAPTPRLNFEYSATSSSDVEIKTNVNISNGGSTNTGNSRPQRRVIWVQPTIKWVYPTSSFNQNEYFQNIENSRRQQEEWSNQKKAQNQKWFQEQTSKNEAESKAWFEQKTAEAQKDLEQWKKDHGF